MTEQGTSGGIEITSADLLATAFALGFMVSREGFNGECDYEHCGPSKLETHYNSETIPEFVAYMEGNKTYRELRDEAMQYLANKR